MKQTMSYSGATIVMWNNVPTELRNITVEIKKNKKNLHKTEEYIPIVPKITTGFSASITSKIVNQSKYALGI